MRCRTAGDGRCPYHFCMRLRTALLGVVFGVAACAAPVQLTVQAPPTRASEPSGHETATVVRVVDGDTVVASITGRVDGPGAGEAAVGSEERVRLIGIDTPESVRPGTPIECFGKEAARAGAVLMDGQNVILVKDVEERDGFERLLRYVYIGDEMANARLVVNGYATAFTYPPNVRHADLFVQLEREARTGERGLWSPETCDGAT
ncbi:MAG: thermonuclease family protein [Actinomycetota bacterium]|nr:thermonuclease family protein [Actinomycetota bacterium]